MSQTQEDIHAIFANLQLKSVKWAHYLAIYDRHLSQLRALSAAGRRVRILEIGVCGGGSLELWLKYFPNCQVYGIDSDPRCHELKSKLGANVTILIGDQADPAFLKKCLETIGEPLDVVVDDGGHTMLQQVTSFNTLYPTMSADGVYLCEDVHTSYWGAYGGGKGKPNTFIEESKRLVDLLNVCWGEQPTMAPPLAQNEFYKSTDSIHFYDSIVCFERVPRSGGPELLPL